LLLLLLLLGAAAQGTATTFVRDAGNALSAILDGPGTPAEKQARIPGFIDAVVDVPTVAQFCLGRFWPLASEVQRRDYVGLFRAVLTRQVTLRVSAYAGRRDQQGQVEMGRAEVQDDGIHVAMQLERPGAPPARMTWLVEQAPAGFRIIDLMVEGTSLRLTLRNDYVSYIQRNGNDIDALLKALRKQVES
jgi:phospholipid transport system substrate-binding protein